MFKPRLALAWAPHMTGVVQELVAAKLPNLHRHLQSISCDMTIIGATDWILCLYTTSLPAEVSWRTTPSLLSWCDNV